jgi:hypothetical protein
MYVKAVPNINMSLDWSRVALVVKVARAERTADHFSRACHSEFTATPLVALGRAGTLLGQPCRLTAWPNALQ